MIEGFLHRRGIDYGWVVLTVTFFTVFTVLGFRHAFGVLYVAILDDTGWLRADTAAIFSVAMVTYMITAVLSGALFDWLGPRIQFPIGCVVLAFGLALCSTITTIAQFYLYYGVVVGLGLVLLGFIPHIALIPQWFPDRRGFGSAVVIAGVGAGSLVVTLICTWLIGFVGWRGTFLVFAGVMLFAILPMNAIFHRTRPDSVQRPDSGPLSATGTSASPAEPTQTTLLEALRAPAFWLMLAAVTMIGAGQMTMAVHQTRLLVDMGYSLQVAAVLFGLTGLFRSIGGFIWGPLSDRHGSQFIVLIAGATGTLGVVALILMQGAPSMTLMIGFTVLFGIGFGGISPVYASIVSELFPGKNLGKIFGLLDVGYGAGSASGPFLAGWVYDRYASYSWALWYLLAVTAGAGVFMFAALKLHRALNGTRPPSEPALESSDLP